MSDVSMSDLIESFLKIRKSNQTWIHQTFFLALVCEKSSFHPHQQVSPGHRLFCRMDAVL